MRWMIVLLVGMVLLSGCEPQPCTHMLDACQTCMIQAHNCTKDEDYGGFPHFAVTCTEPIEDDRCEGYCTLC